MMALPLIARADFRIGSRQTGRHAAAGFGQLVVHIQFTRLGVEPRQQIICFGLVNGKQRDPKKAKKQKGELILGKFSLEQALPLALGSVGRTFVKYPLAPMFLLRGRDLDL